MKDPFSVGGGDAGGNVSTMYRPNDGFVTFSLLCSLWQLPAKYMFLSTTFIACDIRACTTLSLDIR